jgi:hypothetical protein
MTDRLTGLCSRVEPRQGCLRRNEASRRLTPAAANLMAPSSRRRSWPITFRRVVFNLFTHVYIRCWSNSMLRVRPAKIIYILWCVLSANGQKCTQWQVRSTGLQSNYQSGRVYCSQIQSGVDLMWKWDFRILSEIGKIPLCGHCRVGKNKHTFFYILQHFYKHCKHCFAFSVF